MHFIIFDWAFKCFAGWMGGCRPNSKTSNQRWKYRCCKAWIKFHFEHMWSCEWRLQGIISCHFLSRSFDFHASLACILHFSSTEWWLECYPILVFNSHQAHVELCVEVTSNHGNAHPFTYINLFCCFFLSFIFQLQVSQMSILHFCLQNGDWKPIHSPLSIQVVELQCWNYVQEPY